MFVAVHMYVTGTQFLDVTKDALELTTVLPSVHVMLWAAGVLLAVQLSVSPANA